MPRFAMAGTHSEIAHIFKFTHILLRIFTRQL